VILAESPATALEKFQGTAFFKKRTKTRKKWLSVLWKFCSKKRRERRQIREKFFRQEIALSKTQQDRKIQVY
jgi:hypothetical protein